MVKPWFKAVKKFSPQSGESWRKFIDFSGLNQLTELISFDICLCPDAIEELTDEDWKYNVDEDYVCFFFRDLEYLLKRVASRSDINILAAVRNPGEDCRDCFEDDRFEFMGYDVVDTCANISALTDHGGFKKAFRNEELSEVGLTPSFERAYEIQHLLRKLYPKDPHSNCDVWAIWKMKQIAKANQSNE